MWQKDCQKNWPLQLRARPGRVDSIHYKSFVVSCTNLSGWRLGVEREVGVSNTSCYQPTRLAREQALWKTSSFWKSKRFHLNIMWQYFFMAGCDSHLIFLISNLFQVYHYMYLKYPLKRTHLGYDVWFMPPCLLLWIITTMRTWEWEQVGELVVSFLSFVSHWILYIQLFLTPLICF